MANLSLVFDILARDEASSTFRKVGDEAERTGNRASSGLSSIGNAAKAAGGLLLASGIVAGFNALYDAAAESARIGKLTENVIRSTGGAAKISAGQVGDLAGAIAAKTGIDDEAIQSGENLLLTFTNIRNEAGAGNDIFNQTTQIMTDMSAALGTDAAGSAIQLGKALNDPITGVSALTKVGVSFTEQQKDQIRTLVESGDVLGAQKIILGELTREFGGAAEAAATPLDKLKVSVGNIAEAIGTYLIPIVGEFADKGLEAIEGISEGFSDGATDADGFKGAMQDVGGALRDVVGFIQGVADVVGPVLKFFVDLPGPVLLGVGALTAVALLKGPVVSFLETVYLQGLYTAESLAAVTVSATALKTVGSTLLSAFGGPVGLAITGLTVGLGFLIPALTGSGDAAGDAAASQNDFTEALKASNGVINDNVRLAAAKTLQDKDILDAAEAAGISTSQLTDGILGNSDAYSRSLAALEDYQGALYIQAGYTRGEGGQAIKDQADGLQTQIDAYVQLGGAQGQAITDAQQLAAATDTTTASQTAAQVTTESITAAQEELATAADDTKRAIDGITNALDALTGTNISTAEAQAALFQATQQASGALEGMTGDVLDSAGSLNTQSTAGNAAMDVLLGVRDAGNELTSTLAEQGATADEVAAQDAYLRSSFVQTAEQMGISEDAAFQLADQILGIPSERLTTITANTLPAAQAVDAFIAKVGAQRLNISASLSGLNGGAVPVSGYADGGAIRGAGSGTSDSIPALLSNGEYVVRAAAVSKYGEAALDAINSARPSDIALFANGGLVDSYAIPVGLTGLEGIKVLPAGVAGTGGGLGSTWKSIFDFVHDRIPQARVNSSYRPGDPGYHGRGKAVDFGFGSGPGGAGSEGLASIKRLLHDTVGGNLAELIYDGLGDDRSDLKNGRPLTYNAATRAEHHNHVHAAVYDQGGWLAPGLTMAYNGTGQPERIRTAEQEAALGGNLAGLEITGTLDIGVDGLVRIIDGRVVSAVSSVNRGMSARGVR